MGQKFFISFNSADRTKAHWIAWTLKEAGHEVAVHDWEIPAGGNAPLWMNTKLAWADRLIAVISPDYVPSRYSPMEWASQIWNDPDGTKGSVIPVIVRPTSNIPPLLLGLSRIDLTNCSEDDARRRLIKGVDMPAPPERKPAFEKTEGEPPDSQHAGPAEKPTFVQMTVHGNLVIGITPEQYEAGLKKRAEEIRAEEAERRTQLQKLLEKQVELTERATSAEKDRLRGQIDTVEAEKRALEAEGKGVADRLTNLQASYDGLVQKLAEANAALEAFAPLISTEAFGQAQAMLSRGDVLGAERKFVEIADRFRNIREQADVVEARAIFQAGELAEERIDWRAAHAHYARAARLQPNNWQYAQPAGKLAHMMGDYAAAASFEEATLSLVTSAFGPDALETSRALNNLASTYHSLARYTEAEPLFRRAIEIGEKVLGNEHPDVGGYNNNLAVLLEDQGKYDQAWPLYLRAIEIGEKALGKDHPTLASRYNNLAGLLQDQGEYDLAEPLYRRAIEIGEKVIGMDHPDVGTWYNNLAGLLQDQGKYDQAEPLYRRAMEINERILGKSHPHVAGGYSNLAGLLQDQGKYDQAEPLYRRAMEINERVLGKDHPDVATAYNNLATLLRDQGKYDQAEPLFRRAIEILQTTFGSDHPKSLLARKNYDRLQELKKQNSGDPAP